MGNADKNENGHVSAPQWGSVEDLRIRYPGLLSRGRWFIWLRDLEQEGSPYVHRIGRRLVARLDLLEVLKS